jgi:hypothetical protein
MKPKHIFFLATILIVCLFSFGCQNLTTEVPISILSTESAVTPSPNTPTVTKTPNPTVQPTEGSRIISQEKLNCTSSGTFKKCIDETLGIEFEHPVSWGEIEGVLRTGWDSGYLYKYNFSGAIISEDELPDTGGVSINFGEGREWVPTDFAGFGDQRFQVDSCDNDNLYPICKEIDSNVRWMIRFPNAEYLCTSGDFYINPIARVEINLLRSNTVKGFVLEIPFISEKDTEYINKDIYAGFLIDPETAPFPNSCETDVQEAFNDRLIIFIEKLQSKFLDVETQNKLNDLMYFAESITVK